MSWNYRILAEHFEGAAFLPDETQFYIAEVFYDDQGEARGYSDNGAILVGSNLKDLKVGFRMMATALQKPILWAGDRFPEEYTEDDAEKNRGPLRGHKKGLSTGKPLTPEEVEVLRQKYREHLAQGGEDRVEISLDQDQELQIKPLEDE